MTFQSIAFNILPYLPEPDTVSAWDGKEVSGRRKNPSARLAISTIHLKNGHTFPPPPNVPNFDLAAALES
jgi:hypothetical protein